MATEWSIRYPSRAALRREVEACVEAWVEVLTGFLPGDTVRGIYLKGSAQKAWDSPIDYVPELSDVDLHLWLQDDADVALLDNMEAALEVREAAEAAYHRRVAAPVHTPRPQLNLLNRLMAEEWYLPSPEGVVETVYGDEYPSRAYTPAEREAELERDRASLLDHGEFLDALALRVIDNPGEYLLSYLRQLNWRVSPTGPRVLALLGMPVDEVWRLNRTAAIRELAERWEWDLAEAYERYYLAGWKYFLSGYVDSRAAGEALKAGVEVVRRGEAVGRGAT